MVKIERAAAEPTPLAFQQAKKLSMLDLVATPRNPIPPGARVYALNAVDNVSLRMARFSPPGAPRATVALFQGRAEFIEKYFETIDDLLARGFEVVTLDWRGQGGSERELANPRKGHVDDFAQYQRDLSVFLAQMTLLACPKPWFALAHSMGGAILLEYAHGGGDPFRAAGRHRADDRHSRLARFRAAPGFSPMRWTCWGSARCSFPAAARPRWSS